MDACCATDPAHACAFLADPGRFPPHRIPAPLVRPNWPDRPNPLSGDIGDATRDACERLAAASLARLTPLDRAVVDLHERLVALLLSAGAHANVTVEPRGLWETMGEDLVLHVALEQGCIRTALALLDAGAAPRNRGKRLHPLHLACREGRSPMALALLEVGASVEDVSFDAERRFTNPPWSEGRPFDYAALSGWADTAALLLRAGAHHRGAIDDLRPLPEGGEEACLEAWRAYQERWEGQ